MQNSFATKVTTKTIKNDPSIKRLNAINEAIKNAIDAKAKCVKIYLSYLNNGLINSQKDISLVIEDDGEGFDCSNETYMNAYWTHYKGGELKPNALGGRSKGRYSYLQFIDYKKNHLEYIKIYTIYNNQNYCVTFDAKNENIIFKIDKEKTIYKDISMKTQLHIIRLGENFIHNESIEKLSDSIEKEIIVEFADKLLKNISIFINEKKIEVDKYIEDRKSYNYTLTNQGNFNVDIIIWNNEINLIDKKHTFLFNTQGNCMGKIPSGAKKSIFNCHTIFLTSDIFKEEYELIELDSEYKEIINKMQEKYKDDLNKILFQIWLNNTNLMADKLSQGSELFNKVDDMIKEKISEAYKILALPLMINQYNFNSQNVSYFSKSLIGMISDKHSHTLTNLKFVFNLNENEEKQEILSYVNQNIDILTLVKQYYNIIRQLDFLEHFENLVLNEGQQNTKERTELHKIIENNLWIFGKEYAELQFFSDNSLRGIFNAIGLPIEQPNDNKFKKIPDIFIPTTKDKELVLIELKAPKVKINQKILNEVLDKYVLTTLKHLQKQGNHNIDFIRTICVSSTKQQHIATLKEDNYEIKAVTWKEIIDDRKKDNNNNLALVTKKLSLSKYKDLKHFKEQEIMRERL